MGMTNGESEQKANGEREDTHDDKFSRQRGFSPADRGEPKVRGTLCQSAFGIQKI